jgi:glycosyltransferase involved in cell wall biosynthesis
MNKHLISIIIPTYNRAHYLKDTLESIINQTYENWECIIIDDGSTDNTKEFILDYLKRDSRISYTTRPSSLPKGANSCRNFGFELSKGDFIKWFDSDDIMSPEHLEILMETLLFNKADFVVGDTENFEDGTGEICGKPYQFNREKITITAEAFAKQQIGWITDDFLGKKECLKKLKFNTRIITDGDEYNFFTRFLIGNENGLFVNRILTHRRIHNDTLSNPEKYDKIAGFYKVSKIKYLTFLDIERTDDKNLKRWFLKGYMLNSYNLSKLHHKPYSLYKSLPYISKYYSFAKAISFLMSIYAVRIFGKGYIFLKYSRA